MFSNELSILALYGLLVVLVLVAQSAVSIPQLGLPYLASARDERKVPTGLAGRLVRTADNSVVALALFAPAVLILQARGTSTGATVLSCQIFLVCRAAYALLYPAGIPYARTGVWAVAFLANVHLYLLAL